MDLRSASVPQLQRMSGPSGRSFLTAEKRRVEVFRRRERVRIRGIVQDEVGDPKLPTGGRGVASKLRHFRDPSSPDYDRAVTTDECIALTDDELFDALDGLRPRQAARLLRDTFNGRT